MAYPFIVVEGIDGAGKAVQIEELKKMAKKRRERVYVHKFPTPAAKKIYEHLNGKVKLSEDELFEAYSKDIQNSQSQIKRDLGLGWVICDRYAISTVAYQSVETSIEKRIAQIDFLNFAKPDRIILLELPVSVAMKRKAGQKIPDRHESDKKFLEAVAQNYSKLYSTEFMCRNWVCVDADAEPKIVAKQIRESFEKGMNPADF